MEKAKKAKSRKGFLVVLGDFITDHRYFFLILFLGLSVFCFFNINNVSINDSIVSYLPEDTETKQGLDIMDAEFGSLNTMRLMVKNTTPEKAADLAVKIAEIHNVKSILFDGTDASYKNDNALYTIELEVFPVTSLTK